MALREAGIRLTLQGAAEYKAGLKGVSQELRTMSTESKLALAQLGNNASITDTYNTRMKSLGNEIKLTTDKTRMFSDRQRDLSKSQDEITKSIEKTTASYKSSQAETKKLKDEYDKLVESQGKNSKEAKEARAEWKESEKATNALKKELNQLEVAYNQNSKELAKMPNELAKAELATQRLRNEAQKLHEEYRNQGGRLADTAKAWQDFGSKITTVGDGMTQVGDYMTTRFTLPIVAGFTAVMKTGLTFDQQMRQTAAIAGLTAEDLTVAGGAYEQLRNQAIQLGADSIFGATDVATAQEMMASAGFEVVDILSAMPGVMDLAAVSGRDMALASEAVATAMNQFGLEATDASHVADVFARAAADTNAETHDMAEALKYAGNVLGPMGIQFEEAAAAIGIMSNAGVKGSQAGTALRGAFTRLANPTKQVSEAMAELGWSAYDAEGNIKPLSQMIPELRTSLEGLTNEQKDQYLATIFGTNALSGMLALINSAPGEFENLVSSLENSEGAAKSMADVINSGANGAIEELMGSLETLSIKLFDTLAPAFIEIVEGITSAVEAFSNLDESTQTAIVKGALFVAAVGPMISVLGRLTTATGHTVTGIGKMIKWFGKITTPKALGETVTVMGSLGSVAPIVVAGLGLVAGAYWYLASESGKAYRRMQEFPDISGVTETQAQSLRNLADEVATVGVELDTLNTATDFTNLNSGIQGIGSEIEKLNNDKINKLREDFKTLPTDVQKALAGALEQTIAGIESQTSRVQEVMDEINRLTQQGLDENGVLQDAYMQHIRNLSDEMMTYYSLSLAENAEQQREIYQHLTADITEMSREQLSQRIQYLNQAREQENALYQQQQDALFAMWQANAISEQEYYARSEQARIAHEARMRSLDEERIRSEVEMLDRLLVEMEKQGIDTERAYRENMERIAEQYGLTMEELEAIANSVDLTPPVKNMLQYANDATPQLKSAVNQWNTAILDFAYSAGKAVEDLNEQDLQTFIEGIRETGMTWEDLQLLTKEANIDDNLKEFIEAYVEANGGWEALIFAEKQAKANVLGMDELQRLVELFGVDFASLTDEQKEAMINANGAKELSDLMVEYGIWKADSPAEAKRAAVDADPALSAFKELFIAQGWWEDATFPGKIADVDTNKEDFMDDLAQIISEWSGIPVDETKQMLIETNAEDTTRELGTIGGAVEDLNGRQIIIKTREDGSTYIKGDLSTLKQTAEEVDGTTATVYANANGVGESASAMVDFNTQADAMPTEKSSSIKSNVFSTAANTIALLAYNAAVDAMKDKTSTATTQVPRLPADTRSVNDWNQAMRDMFNKTSTATTRTPNISGNTSSVWSWISALNSAYSTSSTFTTYRRTVYQTVGRAFAEGGHIDMFADGGNVKWGGMFANGGMVPKGFMGIVGEAGPELFHVTESGVSITPLAPGEKMRGVEGAIEDYMQGKGSGGGDSYSIDINISDVTIRDDRDIDKLTDSISERLVKRMQRDKKMRKGSVVGFG